MYSFGVKILIVDDIPEMRNIIKKQLKVMGFHNIDQAGDGQQAYNLVLEHLKLNAPFQLIFSDFNMPVMTGLELLRLVRGNSELCHIPFFLVTAEGEAGLVNEALKLRVSDYIVKPFNSATLKQKLESSWKRSQVKK